MHSFIGLPLQLNGFFHCTTVHIGCVVVVVVEEMNIIKVALSHFYCRTTVQSDSVSVARQVTVRRWKTARDILLVSRKGRLEQHSLQFPSEDRKRRRVLNLLWQSVPACVWPSNCRCPVSEVQIPGPAACWFMRDNECIFRD